MAETEEWFIGEVGSLNIGEPALRVTYHSSLNTLLVATKDSKLRVIDVTSGGVLQNSDLSGLYFHLKYMMHLNLLYDQLLVQFHLAHVKKNCVVKKKAVVGSDTDILILYNS